MKGYAMRIEPNKTRMGWSFLVMVLLFGVMVVLALQGCATIRGIGSDLGDIGSPACHESHE